MNRDRDVELGAVRAELVAPVASFRDPLFPGVTRCLPVPPPSTLRGMLAAATGRDAEPVTLGASAHAEGGGVDAETYHPVAADGSNPAVSGRTAAVKGGMTIRDRPFLAWVHVTVWVPDPDADRIAAALRRPVWGLRLGRSQDLVHVRAVEHVTLRPAAEAAVGHALAPLDGHADPRAIAVRLPSIISQDRLTGAYGNYLWCAEPAGRQAITGAYRDGEQAVWLHAVP
jgi:CRISPR-associated Cas5-like protein